jgi:hypothetical protein
MFRNQRYRILPAETPAVIYGTLLCDFEVSMFLNTLIRDLDHRKRVLRLSPYKLHAPAACPSLDAGAARPGGSTVKAAIS